VLTLVLGVCSSVSNVSYGIFDIVKRQESDGVFIDVYQCVLTDSTARTVRENVSVLGLLPVIQLTERAPVHRDFEETTALSVSLNPSIVLRSENCFLFLIVERKVE